MAYSFPEIKKWRGLFLQANSFDVPDGALETCNNAVISKDGIISKIRGWYLYLAGSTNTLKSVFNYRSTLFAAFTDRLSSLADTGSAPNKTGSKSDLSGVTVAIGATRTPRTVEQSNNVYVTTDNGVVKLEAAAGPVRATGVPPGLDLRGFLLPATGGFLGDNQVGYRFCFGRRDANGNLYLGAPSDILVLTNAKVVGATWSTGGGGGPTYTITVTTSTDHNLSSGMIVTVSNANDTAVPSVLNGDHTITVTAGNTFTWTQSVNPTAPGTPTLDFIASHAVRLETSIPTEMTLADGYFYQVYRSSLSGSTAATPSLDFGLIDEVSISTSELAAGLIVYTDTIPDLFRGAELYTNPGSREGEAQANSRPPLADDICLFKDHGIYSSVKSRHSLELNLVSASNIANADWVETKVGTAAAQRYTARTGIGNDTVTATGAGAGTITITYNGHGFVSNDVIYVNNITGTLPEGEYVVTYIGANSFSITSGAYTATVMDISGLTNAAGDRLFQLYTAGTVSVNIRETASALARAINQNPNSVLYANYVSTPLDIPGKLRIQAKGFGDAFSLRASSTTVGEAFTPALPTSFSSGVQVTSTNDDLPHGFYSSKTGEFEAVPLVNFFPVGSKNKKILRTFALRDSIIFLKEDGVFRCDGDNPANFTITVVDRTSICLAPDSADVINNQVIFLSNQGVCLVASNSVRIVSRDIETPLKAVLGSSALAAQTSGAAYESERLYFLTTILPGSTTADVTYVYNTLSDGWSTCDFRILAGAVGPGDIFFHVNRSNQIIRERKTFDRTDFCGQNYASTVVSVASDGLSAVINTSGTPVPGAVLIKSSVINRIVTATFQTPNWLVTFKRPTNIIGSDTPILYLPYQTQIKTSPFSAGAVGRGKQFSQMSLHLRDNSISNLDIDFGTQVYGSSALVSWDAALISSEQGWGLSPWGLFPWGQEDGIASKYQTQPAPVVRVYVPLMAGRGTFLQPILTHGNAGEEINLQAMSFAVRGYGERVSR